ncbi:gluconokinase [Salinibacterium soli]|uniref:Gluconokinase n=1 Tax=Antiquaquibacter soli TaxID=3064523 RepID=A0ABT9BQF4_9MICO|nr:gluconokinase [Protaetiibacter sp. WY-16]MDO7883266.1 gluconokinase [Protaetiibacter sp. WY-16]
MSPAPLVVVMGVSGSGKSTVGALVADRLGIPFADADDLHPSANVEKMRAGHPLDDEDRGPWLVLVGDALAAARDTGLVMACSSLKRAYRDLIRDRAPETVFVYLHGSRELLVERMSAREGHFMPSTLLDSQLDTLEPPGADERSITVDVSATPRELAEQIAGTLGH